MRVELRTVLLCGAALAVTCAPVAALLGPGLPGAALATTAPDLAPGDPPPPSLPAAPPATPQPAAGAAGPEAPPGDPSAHGQHAGHGEHGGGSAEGAESKQSQGSEGSQGSQGPQPPPGAGAAHDAGGMEDMGGMSEMPGMGAHGRHAMPALLGPYGMSRESSGTSWQPESSPHEGLFRQSGAWRMMLHGAVFLTYDDQEGARGGSKWFSTNMVMGMATRELGPGRLGLRAMLSAEPWTLGRNGYPLLLQTGETGNGETPLVDRQHPHDLFDELAATFSLPVGRSSSVFFYLGLPGEPALGPPTYMHRFSAMENPETPLSHHWLDSTHISYGVTTLGWTMGGLKLEGSAFRGREPDQHRTDIESPSLDSYSFRATMEPDPGLAVQASFGHLKSPEQLEPNVDVVRSTVSVMYNAPLAENGNLQSTLAWGRNQRKPGRTTNAYLFEAAAGFFTRHTVFYRIEELENDELVPDILHVPDIHAPFAPTLVASSDRAVLRPVAVVTKFAGGYVYDFLVGEGFRTGAGFDVSVVHVPQRLESSYGADWVPGWMLFLRYRLGGSGM